MKYLRLFMTIIIFSTFLFPSFAQEEAPEEYCKGRLFPTK